MESRKHLAAEKKRLNTHNCAQSVVCTYCDLVGLDGKTALDIAGAYGTGMGNMEGTCGALSGACVLAGLVSSGGDLQDPSTKGATYALSRTLVNAFLARNGATRCADLKGVETGAVLRSCPLCIADAAGFVEEFLFPGQFEKETSDE